MTEPTEPGSCSWPLRVCVWELTLACDARCVHCGSIAGRARPDELDTREALALVKDLARLGCESVTFSGGEPLLRRDWETLAVAVCTERMQLELITNGLGVAKEAARLARAGFSAITFSVDGPPDVHDALRGVPGACHRLLGGAAALRERGVRLGAVTQVNRHNLSRLEETHELLVSEGFAGWQLQLTMPHGRARENARSLCLTPQELPDLERRIVALGARAQLFIQAADNIGYMSRNEARIRTGRGQAERFFTGCRAGLNVVGITSSGSVRGCLSLPPEFDEGDVRSEGLEHIWRRPGGFAYNRRVRVSQLRGRCASCPFLRVCRGGCRSLAVATTGNVFENPFCSFSVERSRIEPE